MQSVDIEQKRLWKFDAATSESLKFTKKGILRRRMNITISWESIYLSVNSTIHGKFRCTFRRISRNVVYQMITTTNLKGLGVLFLVCCVTEITYGQPSASASASASVPSNFNGSQLFLYGTTLVNLSYPVLSYPLVGTRKRAVSWGTVRSHRSPVIRSSIIAWSCPP